MVEDEKTPASDKPSRAANDNDGRTGSSLDPRIVQVARAIGRQIARERTKPPEPANDNQPS